MLCTTSSAFGHRLLVVCSAQLPRIFDRRASASRGVSGEWPGPPRRSLPRRGHATKNSPACLPSLTGQHAEKNLRKPPRREKTPERLFSACEQTPSTHEPTVQTKHRGRKHSSPTKDVLIGLLLKERRHRTMPKTTTSDADSSVSLASFTITAIV